MTDRQDRAKVTFKLHAPSAQEVLMAGHIRDGAEVTRSLRRCKDGTWRTTLRLEPGIHEYRIIVTGVRRDEPGPSIRRAGKPGVFSCVVWV
jgi:1,4-alpha-glucan branching enzyme